MNICSFHNQILNQKNLNITWNIKSNPDFTYCFEDTILLWTPCVVLFLFTIPNVISILLINKFCNNNSNHSDDGCSKSSFDICNNNLYSNGNCASLYLKNQQKNQQIRLSSSSLGTNKIPIPWTLFSIIKLVSFLLI